MDTQLINYWKNPFQGVSIYYILCKYILVKTSDYNFSLKVLQLTLFLLNHTLHFNKNYSIIYQQPVFLHFLFHQYLLQILLK